MSFILQKTLNGLFDQPNISLKTFQINFVIKCGKYELKSRWLVGNF